MENAARTNFMGGGLQNTSRSYYHAKGSKVLSHRRPEFGGHSGLQVKDSCEGKTLDRRFLFSDPDGIQNCPCHGGGKTARFSLRNASRAIPLKVSPGTRIDLRRASRSGLSPRMSTVPT